MTFKKFIEWIKPILRGVGTGLLFGVFIFAMFYGPDNREIDFDGYQKIEVMLKTVCKNSKEILTYLKDGKISRGEYKEIDKICRKEIIKKINEHIGISEKRTF